MVDIHRLPPLLLDVFQGIGNDRKSSEAQEVHLQKPQFLHMVLVKLCHQSAIGNGNWHIVCQWMTGNHHSRRMGGSISWQPFQFSSNVNEPLHLWPGFIHGPQVSHTLKSLVNGNMELVRYKLDNLGHFSEGHAQHPSHITKSTLGSHSAKGSYLGHMVIAIALLDIIYDFFPANIAEVHIYIRHGDTFRIQEALKKQIMLQRVQICNTKNISHYAACCRTTPWAHGNTLLTGMIDEIPDNEEVAVIAHAVDDIQLIFQTLAHFLRNFWIMADQPFLTEMPQIRLIISKGGGNGIKGQLQFAKFKIHLAAGRNFFRIDQGPGIILEQLLHFRR